MLDFIVANKDQLMPIVLAAIVLGGLIVKMTPTKTDDAWFKKVTSFFGVGS